jgi:polyketide synthase PksL
MIVVYGEKYYPLDLETIVGAALQRFSVNNSRAVFSCPVDATEQIIFLQEISDETSEIIQNEIIQSIRQAIMKHFGLDIYAVFLVKEKSIPKTASGKLQRKVCQKQFLENKLSVIKKQQKTQFSKPEKNTLPPRKETLSEFIKLISSVLNINEKEINLDAPVDEYGFDSITLVRLSALINETYHLDITPANFFEYETLSAFFETVFNPQEHHDKKSIIDTTVHSSTQDIAIIGLSCLFPGAKNAEIFWNNLFEEKDSITEIPKQRWNWEEYSHDPLIHPNQVKWGGFIEDVAQFDANFFNITPREAELTDPQQRLFLQEAWRAVEDAGYSTAALSTIKTGLFVGVFNSDYAEILKQNEISDAYLATGIIQSNLANRVSYQLNLRGPSEAINTACSSSLVAIHNAIKSIHQGDCEVAIVGGVNTLLTPTLYISAAKAGMLSEDGRCKTFDKDANGYVRGEGVAAIVLKPYDKAIADHDHIYGVIKGSAVNHGGHVNSLTVPNPIAQAELIVTACEHANIDIDTITYIEAHGTGTSIGDPIEINGLKKSFHELHVRQNKSNPPVAYCGVGSVKSNIGHCESAAGIAGVIKVLLAMQHGHLPASLHFNALNPYIDLNQTPFYIVSKTTPWQHLQDQNQNFIPRRAGVSSFGFGGTNAHVILEENNISAVTLDKPSLKPYLITLSAKTDTALQQRIADLSTWLKKNTVEPSIADISYTLNVGRNHFNKRCIFMASSAAELETMLDDMIAGNEVETCILNLDTTHKERIAPIFREVFNTLMSEITNDKLTVKQYQNKLFALGNFYTQGYELDWEALHTGAKQRISLPTYPFAKDHYWLSETNNAVTPERISVPGNNLLQNVQQDLVSLVEQTAKIKAENIRLSDTLSELGFDSITFKELSSRLEKYYNLQLTPSIFFTYPSIQELSHHFVETYSNEILKVHAAVYHSREGGNPSISNYVPSIDSGLRRNDKITATDSRLHGNVKTRQMNEPIAIIGMQGMFPQSLDTNSFWEHLKSGHDLVTEIPSERWNWHDDYAEGKISPAKTNSKWGGCIPDVDKFDATFFNISSREANFMDPQQRLFMETVWKTIEDAGYDPFSLSEKRVGLFAGVEFSEYQMLLQSQHKLLQGYVFTGNSHAMLANRISYFLNLRGPSEVIDATCASSLIAVHRAVNALRERECEVAIAGGVSLMLSPDTFVITSQLNVLSPDGHCKTFDKSANGYVKGEGVAAILLKPLSKALEDKDHIYAVIKGSAENHGGKGQSLTAPNVSAQKNLLIQAYTQAGISSDTVSYIEAHGTGTELGDPIEIDALIQAFNVLNKAKDNKKNYCGLGSVKTNIGHLEPASGIASIIKVLLAFKHQELPAILHFKDLNPYIHLADSPFYITDKLQAWTPLKDDKDMDIPRRAGISSFGVGGSNAHIVLEEFPIIANETSHTNSPYLITLSAKQKESLNHKVKDLHHWLEQHLHDTDLALLSYTLNRGRTHFDVRCAFVVSSLDELLASLGAYSEGKSPDLNTKHSAESENIIAIADSYLKNQPIDWQSLYPEQSYKRLAGLPAYPFIKKRYWFDEELNIAKAAPTEKSSPRSEASLVSSVPSVSTVSVLSETTLNHLQKIFADVLRLTPDQIDPDTTYEMYGVDSLLGLEIIERLEQDYGSLPKTLLYERNQLRDLASYLQEKGQVKINVTENITRQPAVDNQDIAIVGLSGTFPLAKDMEEFWDNLVTSRDCITEIPSERWNYKDYPVVLGEKTKYFNQGGFIPDIDKFDPLFFNISPYDAALMDPQERLFLQTAWATLEDAGYTRDNLQRSVKNNVGVFVGVTYNFYPLYIAEERAKGNIFPLDIQLFSVANRVSYFLNLKGPSFIVDTACSSSMAAIHLAYESILRGECTMAIAGGVNLSLHPLKYHMLGTYSFLSEQGRCTSFAAGGTGYVPSEGVGAVLLKPLALAIKDNDRIYGVIKASRMNHGGKTSGYSVPNPNAQADLIKQTLESGHIDARSISYIEAHGTGTALGDPIEIRGLQEAFEGYTTDKQFCAIGSVKSNIGHLESAAGISQIAKVLLQMRHKKLVPSLHAEKLNPYIDFPKTPFYVQRELSDWKSSNNMPRRAGVSSFGAGGTNIHMIIEEYTPSESQPKTVLQIPFIYLLSAMSLDQLKEYAQKTYSFLVSNPHPEATWLQEACYTSQTGRESMPIRLAIIATDYNDLLQKFKTFTSNLHAVPPHILQGQVDQAKKIDSNEIAAYLQQKNGEQLATAWIAGAKIAWENLYENHKINKVLLPTYPFAKRRCWIVPEQKQAAIALPTPTEVKEKTNAPETIPDFLKDWLYSVEWQPTPAPAPVTTNVTNENDHWIIFSENELGIRLQNTLGSKNCSYCFEGENTANIKLDNDAYFIKSDSAEEYSNALKKIFAEKNSRLKGIIYLWDLDSETPAALTDDLSAASLKSEASYKLLYLFQALIQQANQQKLQFCLVSRSSQAVTEQHPIKIWQHHLWSLTRVFAAEQPNYQVLLLDLDQAKKLDEDTNIITQEVTRPQFDELSIAYRDKLRYANRLAYYLKDDSSKKLTPWHAPETAIVTGGLGALGIEVVKWLANKGTHYLLLTGNTILPDRAEWPKVHELALKEKIGEITALEKNGVHVIYASVDVTDKAKMQNVIAEAEQEWQKPIKGVFHLAGITTDSITIDKLSRDVFQKVLAVKIQGSLVLHDLFKQSKLDCFVLFSSIAALPYFGMSGLSAYAMANAFLDGFAAFRRRQGLPGVSINWAAWAEKGMSFRYNHSAFLEAVGMSSISLSQGVEILDHILALDPENVGVFNVLWSKFLQVNPETRKLPFFSNFAKQLGSTTEKVSKTTTHLSQEEITTLLAEILAGLLGLNTTEVDANAPYLDYGLDSIMGVNFVGKIGVHFPDVVSPMDLYRYPNVKLLANYISQSCQVSEESPMPEETTTEIGNLSLEEVSRMIEDELKELNKFK